MFDFLGSTQPKTMVSEIISRNLASRQDKVIENGFTFLYEIAKYTKH